MAEAHNQDYGMFNPQFQWDMMKAGAKDWYAGGIGRMLDNSGSPPDPMANRNQVLQAQNATPAAPPNLLQQATSQYPILQNLNLGYVENPKPNSGYLEYWPAGETGDAASPRPKALSPNQAGLEIYDTKTRPIDILGDVVSHQLIHSDPTIKGYYEKFQQSLTPQQLKRLTEQYEHAVKNEKEQRPFAQWAMSSGIPAYFRGYAFQQWPAEEKDKYYTPDQIKMFDKMMKYLGSPQKKEGK